MRKKADFTIKAEAGIYIHIPFCRQKCGYCDFYSATFFDKEEIRYTKALCKEIDLYKYEASLYDFKTLYIGGGTPSLLSESSLEKILNTLSKQNLLHSLQEITIEANPDSLTKEKLTFYKSVGINRISLGIQSFNDEVLKKLGRLSNRAENKKAIEMASSFFENLSLDFIYGIPNQNVEKELKEFFVFNPKHISAYGLSIIEGTPLFLKQEELQLEDELMNQAFYKVHQILTEKSFHHYEISNYGKEGYYSNHNLLYWKQGFYLGLGAGASGYMDNVRYTNAILKDYYFELKKNKRPIAEEEHLVKEDSLFEKFLLGLRCASGIELTDDIKANPKLMQVIEGLVEKEILFLEKDILRASLKGWCLLDAVLRNIYEVVYEG